jgi:hypothetical protein
MMLGSLYIALRKAGAPEELVRQAAEEVAASQNRRSNPRAEMRQEAAAVRMELSGLQRDFVDLRLDLAKLRSDIRTWFIAQAVMLIGLYGMVQGCFK